MSTIGRCQSLLKLLLLLLPLSVAAETAVEMTAVVDSVEYTKPKYEQHSDDCNCLAERDTLLYLTACGPVIGILTLGQPVRILDRSSVTACGRRWSPVLIAGGLVAWTTSDTEGDGPACRGCQTERHQQQRSSSTTSMTNLVVGGPSAKLLHCLCIVESGCNRAIGCRWDVGSDSCGPFQIKEVYWKEASEFAKKKLGGDWKTCTTGTNNMSCSVDTIMFYMARYAKRCVGSGREPTDEDYARIHNGGPLGCRKASTLAYWNKVHTCMVKNS